jgi:hypothetical protein
VCSDSQSTSVVASDSIFLDQQEVSASCPDGTNILGCYCWSGWKAEVCGGTTSFAPTGNTCSKTIGESSGRRRGKHHGAGAKVFALCGTATETQEQATLPTLQSSAQAVPDGYSKYAKEGCSGRNEIYAGSSTGLLDCASKCSQDPMCVSFEFWPNGHPKYGHNFCQLSSTCTEQVTESKACDLYIKANPSGGSSSNGGNGGNSANGGNGVSGGILSATWGKNCDESGVDVTSTAHEHCTSIPCDWTITSSLFPADTYPDCGKSVDVEISCDGASKNFHVNGESADGGILKLTCGTSGAAITVSHGGIPLSTPFRVPIPSESPTALIKVFWTPPSDMPEGSHVQIWERMTGRKKERFFGCSSRSEAGSDMADWIMASVYTFEMYAANSCKEDGRLSLVSLASTSVEGYDSTSSALK